MEPRSAGKGLAVLEALAREDVLVPPSSSVGCSTCERRPWTLVRVDSPAAGDAVGVRCNRHSEFCSPFIRLADPGGHRGGRARDRCRRSAAPMLWNWCPYGIFNGAATRVRSGAADYVTRSLWSRDPKDFDADVKRRRDRRGVDDGDLRGGEDRHAWARLRRCTQSTDRWRPLDGSGLAPQDAPRMRVRAARLEPQSGIHPVHGFHRTPRHRRRNPAVPADARPLEQRDDGLWSPAAELLYPVRDGIVFMGFDERETHWMEETMEEERVWQGTPESVQQDLEYLRGSAPGLVDVINLIEQARRGADRRRLIDVGSGSGWGSRLFAEAGYDPWMVDFEPNSLWLGGLYAHPSLGPGKRIVADAIAHAVRRRHVRHRAREGVRAPRRRQGPPVRGGQPGAAPRRPARAHRADPQRLGRRAAPPRPGPRRGPHPARDHLAARRT